MPGGGLYMSREMSYLPDEVLVELRRGKFGVQWDEDSHLSYVDEDHATEWVNNGIGNSAGGISGITQTPPSLLRYWALLLFNVV